MLSNRLSAFIATSFLLCSTVFANSLTSDMSIASIFRNDTEWPVISLDEKQYINFRDEESLTALMLASALPDRIKFLRLLASHLANPFLSVSSPYCPSLSKPCKAIDMAAKRGDGTSVDLLWKYEECFLLDTAKKLLTPVGELVQNVFLPCAKRVADLSGGSKTDPQS